MDNKEVRRSKEILQVLEAVQFARAASEGVCEAFAKFKGTHGPLRVDVVMGEVISRLILAGYGTAKDANGVKAADSWLALTMQSTANNIREFTGVNLGITIVRTEPKP
jgi:hypothetical protein